MALPTLANMNQAKLHRCGYYVAIAGIETRLATHDWNAELGISGTFEPCINVDSLSGGSSKLNKELGVIETSGFSFSVLDTTTVRAIFQRRGGTEDSLANGESVTDTTITLGSGTNTYANGTDIYVDSETITLGTHIAAGEYTGCTRGAFGSIATQHTTGAVVSDVPRHWVGRRATLNQVFFDTVSQVAQQNEQEIRWGEISSSPRYGNGIWEIESTDLLSSLLNRPLLTGFQDIGIDGVSFAYDATFGGLPDGAAVMTLTIADGFRFAMGDNDAFIIIEADDGNLIYRVRQSEFTAGDDVIKVAVGVDQLGGTFRSNVSSLRHQSVVVRQIHVFNDRLPKIVSQVIHSINGDATNTADDVLPGRGTTGADADADKPDMRVGAGIDSSLVDRDSIFDELSDENLTIPLDETTTLGDFLVREVLWRSGSYVYMNSDGELAFKRHSASSIRSAEVAITDAEILANGISSVDDEGEAIARIAVDCNYDIEQRKFRRKISLLFADYARILGERANTLELASKSLWVGTSGSQPYYPTPMNLTSLTVRYDRLRWKANELTRHWRFPVPFTWWSRLPEGTRISVTSSYAHDHRGTNSVSSQSMEIVGRDLDYESGQVIIDADEQVTGNLIAPSAFVASFSGTTITLQTGANKGTGVMFDDSSPGLDFPDGAEILIYDASTASHPFNGAPEAATISSTTATTIVLTGAPSTTPVAGDLVVLSLGVGDTGNENDVGADVLDFAYAADSSFKISGTIDGPLWV